MQPSNSFLQNLASCLPDMPPRKKPQALAKRGGKQQTATGVRDPSETESIKTPSTASLDKMAEVVDRENKRSASPKSANKIEKDSPDQQEPEASEPEQSVSEKKEDANPAPALPRVRLRDKLAHSATKAVTNGTKQDSTVTYPESEDESQAVNRKAVKPGADNAGSVPDAGDMEVEPEGDTSSRETVSESYSTERIRHTSPISARVLQNVRALKEEILNGGGTTAAPAPGVTASTSQSSTAAPAPGITPVVSHTSSLDECLSTLQERANSILARSSKTPNSSPAGAFRRFNHNQQHGGRFQGNANSSPLNANNPSFKSRFSEAPPGNVPSNRSYQNNGIASSRSWTAGSGVDSGSRFGVKRDAEVDDTRSFKRQRNDSPSETWRGTRDAGRDEGPQRPMGDLRRENDRLSDQDRLPGQNRYPNRDRMESVPFPRGHHNGRDEESRRDEERRPFNREDATGRYSPNRDRYGSPDRDYSPRENEFPPQDRQMDRRPVGDRFNPGIVSSQSSRSVAAPAGNPSFNPPGQFGARGPANPATASQQNGPSTSGFSKASHQETNTARAGVSQDLPQSGATRFNGAGNGTSGTNNNAPDPRPANGARVSRFSAPLQPAGSQPGANKAVAPAGSLPALTAANLGRNVRDPPESRTFRNGSVSRQSEDGRSIISESRRYVCASSCA